MGAFSNKVGHFLSPPNPVTPTKPSGSQLHIFNKAAVCADGIPCAKIGKEIFEKNGSVVDAAIATLFCNGIVNMQSMGLGGGFFMTIYIREEKRAYTLNAREFAPLNTTADLYKSDPKKSKKGPLAVGVPGELRGYWSAYQRFGKLPWKDLIQPSIDLCEQGYKITIAQHDSLVTDEENIKKDTHLKTWFVENEDKFKPTGSLVKPSKLCETLKIIANEGGDALYNGSLAKTFVKDIQDMGGIITEEDMKNYTVEWLEPVQTQFRNGDHFYSMPMPGCGLLLAMILNTLDGYNLTSASLHPENIVQTYQRAIEAFKYAYARRSELGDMNFLENVHELVSNLSSHKFADNIRSLINETKTSNDPQTYGGVFITKNDHGTAHVSILAENGDAVSATSTINLYFGAGLTSKNTGIILNSGMDDFSFTSYNNYFGIPYSPNNKVEPMKRALSSMSPTIITDKDGDVKLVVGASGGTKIITAVAQVIMRILWCDQNIKEAVDAPRFHHQLYPMQVQYEYGTLQQIVEGLEKLGHNTTRYTYRGSIVCAILRKDKKIFANADFRKGGDVFGID
ncbi:gamma glutamyl transpeptidase [Holotrichia oblita]|uniref:Gamma glutamyl transpeptidase n=1 Tax=Holotrichia oblita TaxID=644536 RepID=A0ACB9SQ92_HOLOL|nr:gamma glutamyl transpeptidase [Holotrichia oblita]